LRRCNYQALAYLVYERTLYNPHLVQYALAILHSARDTSNMEDSSLAIMDKTISSNIGEVFHSAQERQDVFVQRAIEAVIANVGLLKQ
jgi:hypothetical protein